MNGFHFFSSNLISRPVFFFRVSWLDPDLIITNWVYQEPQIQVGFLLANRSLFLPFSLTLMFQCLVNSVDPFIAWFWLFDN